MRQRLLSKMGIGSASLDFRQRAWSRIQQALDDGDTRKECIQSVLKTLACALGAVSHGSSEAMHKKWALNRL